MPGLIRHGCGRRGLTQLPDLGWGLQIGKGQGISVLDGIRVCSSRWLPVGPWWAPLGRWQTCLRGGQLLGMLASSGAEQLEHTGFFIIKTRPSKIEEGNQGPWGPFCLSGYAYQGPLQERPS